MLLAAVSLLSLVSCDRAARTGERNKADSGEANPAPTAFYASKFEREPNPVELTTLGRALFFDPVLSASGRMACSSCHDPAHAWGPPNARAVQLGGVDMKTPGLRAVPSLRYEQDTPAFTEHFVNEEGGDSGDQGPAGGRDWDGRASSAHEQARAPLLSPFEMANHDSAAVIAKLRASANAQRFRATFGDHILDSTALAWNGLLMALEVFQQSPENFYPYSSKYDAFLRGHVKLTSAEQRGLATFNNPAKGNCAQCHPSEMRRGASPQFTDHGFVALGVPRNPAIPANADPAYFDLGLCGPLRTDLSAHHEYCGMFKTPSLRNSAIRHLFFHNGVYATLEQVLRFYQRRDTRLDDLPAEYRKNVSFDAPFDSTARSKPRFTNAESADIIAFLRTLTDGYR
jgi:cytochrome c peroxidase